MFISFLKIWNCHSLAPLACLWELLPQVVLSISFEKIATQNTCILHVIVPTSLTITISLCRTRFNSLRYGACKLHCVLSPSVISFSTSLLQFNTIQGQFFQYDYSRSSLDSLPFSFASTCLLRNPNSNSLLILFVWHD